MTFSEMLAGPASLVVAGLLIALACYWALFPWFVYRKLNELIAQGKAIEAAMRAKAGAVQVTMPSAPLPPLPGHETYFVAVGENITGPHPRAHVQALLNKTMLPWDAYVLREGEREWKAASVALAGNHRTD